MLLANMSVAERLTETFPQQSLLRHHSEPRENKLQEFQEFCDEFGLGVDTSSSAALCKTLAEEAEKKRYEYVDAVLQHLATTPMQRAKYFCTGDLEKSFWMHYALHVQYYTHFTSPIRRYADTIVHRILARCLESSQQQEYVH